jgi:hypothetical protein
VKKTLSFISILFLINLTVHAQTFTIGETVECNGTNVNVRNVAAGTVIGQHSTPDQGTVKAGPVTATLNGTSYIWYEVSWNTTPLDGWVAANYLSSVGSAPGTFTLTLTPQCDGTTSEIILNWTSSSGATSYDVYRNGALYYSGLTGTTFTNKGANVTSGTSYSYYVQAKNSSGSTNSNTQSATAPNCSTTCTYSLSSYSVSVPSTSGDGSVNVIASASSGCSNWSAVSTASWLHVTSGSSGTGSSTVNYSYDVNPGSSSRPGTITIAGNTFKVTQEGIGSSSQGVLGVDVSDNNGSVSWPTVYAAGKSFAYVKATEGTSCSSCVNYFNSSIKSSNPNKVVLGAYHLARPDNGHTGLDEANYFLSVASSYIGNGYLPPALDMDASPIKGYLGNGHSIAQLAQWINDWCMQVYNYNGKHIWPVLYGDICNAAGSLYPYYQDGTINPNIKLWIADYSHAAGSPGNSPSCPATPWVGWPWDFDQYFAPCNSCASNDPNTGMDLDIFYGDMDEFNALVNGGTTSDKPDLIITAGQYTVDKTTVSAGSTITATASEDNIGTAEAGSTKVGLWLSSSSVLNTNTATYLGNITGYPSLSAGSNSNVLNAIVTIPSNTIPGQYYLFFWADGGSCGASSNCTTCSGNVTESDECNNFATISPITVTSNTNLADLTITNNTQSVSATTVAAGSTITAYASEDNQGTTTSGSNEVELWLSSSSVLNTNTAIYLGNITGYPSLSAGSNSNVLNATVTIPSNTIPGQYYLFFWADGGSCGKSSNCTTCSGNITESDECNNFATISPITVTSVVLETNLISFDVLKKHATSLITWNTTEENNIDKYEIERSTNGDHFANIGIINAANSTSQSQYSFTDNYPFNGKNYYRLKIISNDGTITFSNVKMIEFSVPFQVDISPNPIQNSMVNVTIRSTKSTKGEIVILNAEGKKILHQKINIEKGSTTDELNINNISNGIYYLRLITNDKLITKKFIKSN